MEVGDRVIYSGTGEKEYGIVIHVIDYPELGEDCIICFYGTDGFPERSESLKSKPYLLRYLSSSLEKVDGQDFF